MEGGGLGRRGRRRKEGLGVGWEVVAAVGRVEALREDNDLGACGGCFADLGCRMLQVGGLVWARGELHARELNGLLENGGGGC